MQQYDEDTSSEGGGMFAYVVYASGSGSNSPLS
jgi:hypothetical protein